MVKPQYLKRFLLYAPFFLLLLPSLIRSSEVPSSNYFNMSLQDLMDVEVVLTTAGKTPEKIANIPASVVIVDRNDIKRYGYRTLQEILNHIPGVFPINDYSWDGQNYGVRGFWSGMVNRNMIIMVNGVKQVDDYGSNYPSNKINVPVEAIDRIEVIRGPMSVIYGVGAFFGVINVVTNQENDFEDTMISTSYGTQNTYEIFFRNQQKQSDIKHNINISISGTDGINQPLNKMSSFAELFPDFYNVTKSSTAKLLSQHHKYLNLHSSYKTFYSEISYTESTDKFYMFYPSYSDGTTNNITKINGTLGLKLDLFEKLAFSTRFDYQYVISTLEYNWYIDDFFLEQRISSKAYEIDINLNYKLYSNFDILAGYNNRNAFHIDNSLLYASIPNPLLDNCKMKLADGNSVMTHALYSQINFSPIERIKLVAGIRAEYMPEYNVEFIAAPTAPVELEPAQVWNINYKYDQWEIIPRVAALYTISNKHIVKFLYGQAINRPSFQQTIDDIFQIQSKLKPEKIKTYEINYLGSFSSGYSIGLSIFKNELHNLLIRDHNIDEETGVYSSYYSNIGKMLTNGIEFTLKTRILDRLLFNASITYQETEDQRNADIAVAYSPNWLGYFQASYTFRNMILAMTARYVDMMQPFYNPIILNSDGSSGTRIGHSVPGYVSINGNFRIENIWNKFYINLHGSNLLDEDIYFPVFNNNPWADKGTMDWGRRFILTCGIHM